MEEIVTPRLGVQDKRDLFQVLLAMTERLFMLNKFPVDQDDFALSLVTPEKEAAWRLLREDEKESLSPSNSQKLICNGKELYLHLYPGEGKSKGTGYIRQNIFMHTKPIDIDNARRHQHAVKIWCERQLRLEEQLLRAAKVIKSLVHSCNTVGQYKRVSPDLLTFLPEKYRDALKGYSKGSPYPTMSVEPKDIDTMLATLAYAALQPMTEGEAEYRKNLNNYYKPTYNLKPFPRSSKYDRNSVRRLEL